MNVQIQARKLSQYIMVPLAALLQTAWLAWVKPGQPLPLQLWLWIQEGNFISPEEKAQGEAVALGTIPPKDKVMPLIPPHNVVMNRPLLRKGKSLETMLGREIAETMI